jgi:hypothetical protein
MTRSMKLTPVLAAAAALALAGPAQAAVIDTDPVRLTDEGYDFGNPLFVAGAPTGSGDPEFDFTNMRITPRLIGTMHVDDADGTCARMRLTYRDDAGDELTTRYGSTLCVDDDDHYELPTDLDPYADDEIDRVQVAVERESATGWSTVESDTYTVDTHDDDVRITEDGVDFGGDGFSIGAPAGSGEMNWDFDDGDVTPRLVGALHLNNSSGVCARIRLRYLTDAGLLLTTREDAARCANDNGHHEWTIDFDPHTSNKIGQVRVQLQTQANNGSWLTAGAETVSIAE